MIKPDSAFKTKWLPWLGGLLVIGLLLALWPLLSNLGANSQALRAGIDRFGPLAPLAFFALNVAQIVVAPLPGYPIQVLGGVLFGFWFGSLITVGGMVTGGVLAAWLGRRLGRPWLEKRLGAAALQHWGQVAPINSFWTWWLILLLPVGDIPYFLAGLSQIRLGVLALAILTSRGLFTLLIVWLGDSVVNLPLGWLAALLAGVGLALIAGFSQAHRLEAWARALVLNRAARPTLPPEPARRDF